MEPGACPLRARQVGEDRGLTGIRGQACIAAELDRSSVRDRGPKSSKLGLNMAASASLLLEVADVGEINEAVQKWVPIGEERRAQ